MELQNKVVLDTNMLNAIEQFKVDVFERIKDVVPEADFYVSEAVKKELKELKKKSKKLEKQANIAELALKKNKVKTVKTEAKNADKSLLELAKKGFIVATNDKELRKQIGIKCLVLRKKKLITML